MSDVTLDAIVGWIDEDAGSAWGHRHAMLAQDYDDDYGDANQEGFVGFGIAQTTNAGVAWKTVVVVNFTNPVADAQAGACGYNITVSTNSLTNPPCNTPPTINSVTATQPPDCNNQTGSITVNATGAGTLEFTVNGNVWQVGNTFTNLAPGNYNAAVRLQATPNCLTNYNQNPVVLNAPMGCNGNCMDYVATGLPIPIPDNTPAGVTSTVNVQTAGTITDVNIKNLTGNHTYIGALVFTLQSPQGTVLTLINNACNANGGIDFNLGLDDQAANPITCPYNTGNTEQPQNALSAFNGQNPLGTWTLTVADNDAFNDAGMLNTWTLEICTQGAMAQGYTCATAVEITQPGTFNAPGPSQGNGAIAGSGFTHANWYRFTPPMTGMIRIFTCGLAGAGNQHNHVYTVNTASCAALNLNDVIYTEDRGCTQNQADGVKLENVPVTAGVPIYIEWDDALSNTPFTWTLEYQAGGGGCMDYVAGDVPTNILDQATITSTINVPTGGTIAGVNITNLKGTHAFLGDLTFTLMSPMGTSVVLIQNECGGDASGFDISLNDGAAGALDCPLSDVATERPENLLSAFNGQNPMGNWILMVNDNGAGDVGVLRGWTLEICTGGGGNCPPNLPVNDNPIAAGTFQAGTQLTSAGSVGVGNNVIFRAGNNVELQPNFTVPLTSIFEARIEGCQ
ncbi:MAG: proprotein convertase P-domain-containing protein [Saprospiraceae bacterium]|nr:proprotein convertase P-domain-containing protein [Saprospiraceae bacterium]